MSNDPTDREETRKRTSEQIEERQISRDSETIRGWADEYDAVPVRATTTQGESGRFRMIPQSEVGDTHERMEWNDFFSELEESDHVVIHHGREANKPFEITGQSDVISRVDDEEIEERLIEGETVTSTITETSVVESVVVEEATVESELTDREIIQQRVVDAELLDRECMGCDIVPDGEVDAREWFDGDRYLETVEAGSMGTDAGSMGSARTSDTAAEPSKTPGGSSDTTAEPSKTPGESSGTRTESASSDTPSEFPYHAELDVEETWSITRELTERFVVESRITDTDVTEAETIEDHDVDVKGLHRSIVEGGIIEEDRSTDEMLTHYEIDSELSEANRITTNFTRDRTVEEEVIDRKRITADMRSADRHEMETIRTTDLETEREVGSETTRGMGAETDREMGAETGRGSDAGGAVTLTEDAIGHDVVDATGDKLGIVSEVDEDGNAIFIDPQPGIAARIQAALGWGDEDEDDYRLGAQAVERITDDAVELKSHEHLSDDERER